MLADLCRTSALPAVAAMLLLGACTAPREHRAQLEVIERQWDDDEVPEDSLEELIEHLRELGDTGAREPTALASIVALSRVAAGNPAHFARAEALRNAWRLAAELPPQPLREDDVQPAAFSQRTRRYEELMADPELRGNAEHLELIDFMGRTRFPVGQLGLALDLADLVVSQALWGADDAVREAFAEHAEASALHALTATTLRAAYESQAPFLRQQGVESARHLPVELGLTVVGDALDRDPETLVALEAMDTLRALAPRAEPRDVRALLDLARRRGEPAVSDRADDLEATLAP